MRAQKNRLILAAACLLAVAAPVREARAQSAEVTDIKMIAAKGRLAGTDYQNDFFRIVVHVPSPNTFQQINSIVDENRAQLLNANNTTGPMEQRHNFAVIVQSGNIPGLRSIEQYVRSVRHSLEKEGLETVLSEVPVSTAGHTFTLSTLRSTAPGEKFYKGISCTMLNGYIFGFWVEAANEAELNKLLDLNTRLKFW